MKAVFDTSPLQALHRGGILASLSVLYEGLILPSSVDRQTREAFSSLGERLVPNLDLPPRFEVHLVASAELLAVREPPPGFRRRGGGGKSTEVRPRCYGYGIDLEELEVIVLAKRLGAIAIVDDHSALRSAGHLQVQTATTREVLAALVAASVLAPAGLAQVMERITATGYVPTRRSSTALTEMG